MGDDSAATWTLVLPGGYYQLVEALRRRTGAGSAAEVAAAALVLYDVVTETIAAGGQAHLADSAGKSERLRITTAPPPKAAP